ncbi:MAG: DUF5320 domain-containing protein [Dysgonamonadaceae bacterium]|nr:DUF5320 domain-containing protein [Dysgonamonadaceae bacterium]MDD3728513.1 DUF5320 domain-containing protein [Dysgonamonadaceae bacterium]
MSNFNQKGPMGEGPMTGRRMGRCTNYGVARRKQTNQENENVVNPSNDNFFGRFFGRGRGRGMGNGMGQNRGGRGMGRSGGGSRGMGIGRQGRFRDDI